VCQIVGKIRDDNIDPALGKLAAFRQLHRVRIRPFEIDLGTWRRSLPDPLQQSHRFCQMLDQVAGVKSAELDPGECRKRRIEIDCLPSSIQIAVLADFQIDAVKLQIRTRRPAPVFPMRQPATAGADVEDPRVPR